MSSANLDADARPPLDGRRILLTGAAGQIGKAIARQLVRTNEVWGVSRFTDAAAREELNSMGVRTAQVDLGDPDFSVLPDSVDHVLHLASYMSPAADFDLALRVNAVGTGKLMKRFRDARSVLIMSTASVYAPHPDPLHKYLETDPLGDVALPIVRPTYSISKIAQEAVAKFAAEAFGVPTIIGRMNIAYGRGGGWPARHLAAILAGETIVVRGDPMRYSPIHEDDIVRHLGPLLDAAEVPPPVVNFCGDEVVSSHEWCEYLGELTGIEPIIRVERVAGSQLSVAADPSKRIGITGPCRVTWREGVRDLVDASGVGRRADS